MHEVSEKNIKMDDFRRSQFTRTEVIDAIRIPAKYTNTIIKHERASQFVWMKPGNKSVYPCPSNPREYRIVLMKADLPVDLECFSLVTRTKYTLSVSYEDFSAEEVLRVLIPGTVDPPTSFETIGHIAHMNLREEFMPHKFLIGEVLLDKNRHIDLVVTKVGELSGDFRTFAMDVIATRSGGNSTFLATVFENKMRLLVDYEHCYWNSRLSTERTRLLKEFTSVPNCRLIDMCCGVGALACFAAREGIEVHANDLNPDAVRCLLKNASGLSSVVQISNSDAREFMKQLAPSGDPKTTNCVMINLPEIGIEFLDVFVGLGIMENFKVFCHCFSRANPPDSDIRQRVYKALEITDPLFDLPLKFVHIRDVAPNKIMYSVEFTVPESILRKQPISKKPRHAEKPIS